MKFLIPLRAKMKRTVLEGTLVYPASSAFYAKLDELNELKIQAGIAQRDTELANIEGQINALKWIIDYGQER